MCVLAYGCCKFDLVSRLLLKAILNFPVGCICLLFVDSAKFGCSLDTCLLLKDSLHVIVG